ncbi:hypothetical protein Tco_0052098 [Tanacetum coccineum]
MLFVLATKVSRVRASHDARQRIAPANVVSQWANPMPCPKLPNGSGDSRRAGNRFRQSRCKGSTTHGEGVERKDDKRDRDNEGSGWDDGGREEVAKKVVGGMVGLGYGMFGAVWILAWGVGSCGRL